jgi:hypothetical protein
MQSQNNRSAAGNSDGSFPYTRRISYRFNVLGQEIEIYDINDDGAWVSETRFNGQEDTHMVMPIERINGAWVWEDDDEEFNPFVKYHSKELAKGILRYINAHGIPSEAIATQEHQS